jgi:hypothetical protein
MAKISSTTEPAKTAEELRLDEAREKAVPWLPRNELTQVGEPRLMLLRPAHISAYFPSFQT